MYGVILGDIVGSIYEGEAYRLSKLKLKSPTIAQFEQKTYPLFKRESRFTDDTVLSVAIADAILTQEEYNVKVKTYGQKYPTAGYGGSFIKWLNSKSLLPYNSFGNGSAMRVTAVAWAFDTLDEVLQEAEKTAAITHNHPEGIKGAKSVAAAIFMARKGENKAVIKTYIETNFGYDLSRKIKDIRDTYMFDVTCQGSVPEAIIAFLDSDNFEHAIRLAVSLGGDTDTQAAIAASIAEAYYQNIDPQIVWIAEQKIDKDLRKVVREFRKKYM